MEDFARALICLPDGGFALGGYSKSFRERNESEFYLVRTDSVGDELWSTVFGVRHRDICNSLVRADDGGYVLAGRVSFENDSISEPNMGLLKTTPDPVSVPQLLDPIYPSEHVLNSAYPNPFNTQTRISYNLDKAGLIMLKIYDLAGRELAVLKNGMMLPGQYLTIWDGGELTTGIYLCSLETDKQIQTIKLSIIR